MRDSMADFFRGRFQNPQATYSRISNSSADRGGGTANCVETGSAQSVYPGCLGLDLSFGNYLCPLLTHRLQNVSRLFQKMILNQYVRIRSFFLDTKSNLLISVGAHNAFSGSFISCCKA